MRTWGGALAAVALCLFPARAQDDSRGVAGGGRMEPATGLAPSVTGTWQGEPIDFGRYHALLIGINEYAQFPRLVGPVNDVDDLSGLLRDSFGFSVRTLRDGEATRDRILAELRRYGEELGDGDSLLVWYAGHGCRQAPGEPSETPGRGYWLPIGASREDDSTWISFEEVKRELERTARKADHVLLVSDSCFSGGLSEETHDLAGSEGTLDELVARPSFQVMTSGRNETVTDVYKHGNSPFSTAFKRALRGIARELLVEDKPFKTASEVFAEIRRAETRGKTPTAGRIAIEGREGAPGEFVFAWKEYFLTSDQLRKETWAAVRRLTRPAELLPDGRQTWVLVDSPDDAPMVLVEGDLARVPPVRPFLIDRDEVTVGRFRRFLADVGTVPDLPYVNLPAYGGDEAPVVGVSFELARMYAAWAGESLPNESEWEAAAGYVPGHEGLRVYPWGDEPLPAAQAPRWQAFPGSVSAPTADVSWWGARRLASGVREWCLTRDERIDRAVIRGGAQLVASLRDRPDPDDPRVPESLLRVETRTETSLTRVPYRNVGFRCVKRLR